MPHFSTPGIWNFLSDLSDAVFSILLKHKYGARVI